jgi:hypothetical protein
MDIKVIWVSGFTLSLLGVCFIAQKRFLVASAKGTALAAKGSINLLFPIQTWASYIFF